MEGVWSPKIEGERMISIHDRIHRSLRNHAINLPKKKATARVAINEYLNPFNVRINHLELVAGREAIIKIKPTRHVATEGFAELDVKHRKCLFPNENPVKFEVAC